MGPTSATPSKSGTASASLGLGRPFSVLPVPDPVELLTMSTTDATLTVARATAVAPERGTALLVHGFTGSKEDFYPIMPLLAARGYTTYALTQRGAADSTGPDSEKGYALDDFVSDVRALRELIGRPVHLLGHSFGGPIAQAAVLAEPSAFTSLTMLCSGPRGWADRLADIPPLIRSGGGLGLWKRENSLAGVDPSALSVKDRFLRDRLEVTAPGNLIGAVTILADPADRTEDLGATGVPVLIAHGETDDAWPQDWQRGMAERLGESGTVSAYSVIPGAGHLPNEEQPEALSELLAGFWGRCDSAD